MTANFYSAPGQFYRGNLHTHSTQSDGVLSAQEVCRRYQEQGYDFISLTDHFVGLFDYPISDTSAFRNEQFTTILGAELHTGAMENGHLWHLVAVGLPTDFAAPNAPNFLPVNGSETAPNIAQRARDAGAFVAIAHPHWSGLTQADARSITAAHAVEIYNHGCAVDNDRGEGFLTLEHLLNEDRHLNLIATDDAHFNSPDFFGGWVMVKAKENSPTALLDALKAGAYYSTTGPEIIDIRATKGSIEVECSPAANILVQGQGSPMTNLRGDGLTTGKLSLERLAKSPWVRITVMDKDGKRAWSNPIWIDELP